jgi:hypothetical protein
MSIFVDWFYWHSSSMMKNQIPIGPSARLRSLCAPNDDAGSISQWPTRIVAQRAS